MKKLIKCISLFLSIVTASVSLVSCNVGDVSGTASESSEIIVSETEMLIETDQLPDITSKNYEDDFLLWIMKDTNQV